MEFITIFGGSVVLGAKEDDKYANHFEIPQAEVEIGIFEIVKDPVSIGDWADFIEKSGYQGRGGNYLKPLVGKRLKDMNVDDPITWICREDAEAYCNYYKLLLPTEAQWECAAATLGERVLGLWTWCRDMWDEYYLVSLARQDVAVDPFISFPDFSKLDLNDEEQKIVAHLSGYGTARGCGEEWLRFGRSLRFPLKRSPQRRYQVPVEARHPHLGLRPVYVSSGNLSEILAQWAEPLFEDQ